MIVSSLFILHKVSQEHTYMGLKNHLNQLKLGNHSNSLGRGRAWAQCMNVCLWVGTESQMCLLSVQSELRTQNSEIYLFNPFIYITKIRHLFSRHSISDWSGRHLQRQCNCHGCPIRITMQIPSYAIIYRDACLSLSITVQVLSSLIVSFCKHRLS